MNGLYMGSLEYEYGVFTKSVFLTKHMCDFLLPRLDNEALVAEMGCDKGGMSCTIHHISDPAPFKYLAVIEMIDGWYTVALRDLIAMLNFCSFITPQVELALAQASYEDGDLKKLVKVLSKS
jgi:hypothetical protein